MAPRFRRDDRGRRRLGYYYVLDCPVRCDGREWVYGSASGRLEKRAVATPSGAGGATIKEEAMPNVKPLPVPVKKGGVVFMHKLTPHRSTPNFTKGVRWSLDLRYQPIGQPTGRAWWPDFVAQSVSHPDQVLTDYDLWCEKWEEALSKNTDVKHRIT